MPPAGPTYFNVTDPQVRQNWERELHYEVIRRTALFNPEYGLVGDKPTFLCQRKKEVFKQGGTRATLTLMRQLRGSPTRGNATLREHEEGLDTGTFQWDINKLRHAVMTDGEIVDQRVTWDTLEEAKIKLGEWWSVILEAGAMMHLAGYTVNANRTYEWWLDGTDLGKTLNNAPRAPDTFHIFRPLDLTDDATVGTTPTAVIDLRTIDKCIALAKTLPLPIKPIMYKDKIPLYVMFLHTYHVQYLRENFSSWFSVMQSALRGGAFEDNPIFTGALGVYSNTLFIESPFMPPGVSSGAAVANTRRAVFCGAQALVLGLGKRYADENQFRWLDEKWDYGDKFGCAAGLLAGLAAPYYTLSEDSTAHDFGKIVVTGYANDIVSST
jgi:N4-gp56 family major capsid protein